MTRASRIYKQRPLGFTLIELMLVVALLSILSAVVVVRVGKGIRKSQEAMTKGNLGALRSALSIYYADNNGVYPQDSNDDLASLTMFGKYLKDIPVADTRPYHPRTNTVHTCTIPDDVTSDDGYMGWIYGYLSDRADWGMVLVSCIHADLKGKDWSTY